MGFSWPLMRDSVVREDLDAVIEFLKGMPRLTQGDNVAAFECEWSQWLGVRYSTFVNSGASANYITLAVLRELHGTGEVIVPPLTWVSDIVAVLQHGFRPVFVDINPNTLCMDDEQIIAKLSPQTKAVFMTHAQGFNGLTDRLVAELARRRVPLLEDVCEAHGATFAGCKLGALGLMSNFSFYFAHHMSTIEGGMVCTNDERIHRLVRMFRSHGMVREAGGDTLEKYSQQHPDLNPNFIFAVPGYNMRNTEIGAVIGRRQLQRLDQNNRQRRENFATFLSHLDSTRYRTDFHLEGSCNYALNLVIRDADPEFRDRVERALSENGIECRRGSAGGGNQLRQPYLRGVVTENDWLNFPEVEHIHFYGFYIGNYPGICEQDILDLCRMLNSL